MKPKWKAAGACAMLLGVFLTLWLWVIEPARQPASYVALPPVASPPAATSPAQEAPAPEVSPSAKRDAGLTAAPMTDVAATMRMLSDDVTTSMRMLSPAEASNYVGDRACSGCHADIHQQQSVSRHARTLRRVSVAQDGAAFRLKQTVNDPLSGYSYQPDVENGRCIIKGRRPLGRGSLPADFVMGSGRNGQTYFSSVQRDAWVVLRISYYNKARRWDFTPAQKPGQQLAQQPGGTLKVGSDLVGCLLCHVTVLRAGAVGPDIQRSQIGIGCERCHGPGRAHVEQGRPMERLGAASPDRINKLCGACHHDATNSPLDDPRTQNGMARFEGVALPLSKCYQVSKTLSCNTCHNPHTNADPDPKRNDAKCLGCHTSAPARHPHKANSATAAASKVSMARVSCPVNPKSGCVHCHMPSQSIATIPHAKYRNHWIKVWTKPAARRDPRS